MERTYLTCHNPSFVLISLTLLGTLVVHVNCRIHSAKSKTFEGDILMSRQEMKSLQNEIVFTGKVHPVRQWPNGIIPFIIQSKFDTNSRRIIEEALDEITGNTCIKFIGRTTERNYIEFVVSQSRCSSNVGMVGGRQEVMMSTTCMRHGTVVHELLHALGLYHEQSRPDRDKYIDIIWKNLKSRETEKNFETYATPFWMAHTLPYDYGSIMHYSSEAFSKKYGDKTILTKTKNAPIGQRTSMSHFDKVKINMMYSCPEPDDEK